MTHFSFILACCARCSQLTSHDQWMGIGGTNAWPSPSPALNPLDFYLWGHLNTTVYAAPVYNEEARSIVGACQTICNYPGNFEWMQQSMMRQGVH
jgi:hypothetical protein